MIRELFLYIFTYSGNEFLPEAMVYMGACTVGLVCFAALSCGGRHFLLAPLAMETRMLLMLSGGMLALRRTNAEWYQLTVGHGCPLMYHPIPVFIAAVTFGLACLLARCCRGHIRLSQGYTLFDRCLYLLSGSAFLLSTVLNIIYWYSLDVKHFQYSAASPHPVGQYHMQAVKIYFLLSSILVVGYTLSPVLIGTAAYLKQLSRQKEAPD